MTRIESFVSRMVELGASDLHLTSGKPASYRVDGELQIDEQESVLTVDVFEQLLIEIAPEHNRQEFEETNDTDFAYEVDGVGRVRANFFRSNAGPCAVFRLIPQQVLTLDQLGAPESVRQLCGLTKGLVVVTGPTGSGKSTTLASMVDHINHTRRNHIITIEDPIEFVHTSDQCLIRQREMHRDTKSFKAALRAALREDPDVVLVGEMRDLETIEMAIETAETGHLVFGTLHTTTAAGTVDRVIDSFPANQQAQIRAMLSTSLKGVVAQTLCKRKPKGRVAAYEVLIGTSAVANMIRDGKTHQIPSAIQLGGQAGMRTLSDSLLELVGMDLVDPGEAWRKSADREEMANKLQGLGFNLRAAPAAVGV